MCSVFHVQCLVFGLQSSVFSLQCPVCNVQSAMSSLQASVCPLSLRPPASQPTLVPLLQLLLVKMRRFLEILQLLRRQLGLSATSVSTPVTAPCLCLRGRRAVHSLLTHRGSPPTASRPDRLQRSQDTERGRATRRSMRCRRTERAARPVGNQRGCRGELTRRRMRLALGRLGAYVRVCERVCKCV
jgi:hypothetical protein